LSYYSSFFSHPSPTTDIYTLSLTTLFRSLPRFPFREKEKIFENLITNRKFLNEIDNLIIFKMSMTTYPPIDKVGKLFAQHLLNQDRKSTRLNSSHSQISYAVFCLKKKT